MSDIEARPDGRGMLLVVAGPSGVGKGTIIEGLRARHCAIEFSVSVTTRSPRPGEVEGVDYRFVSEAEFLRMRREGELLEWARGAWHAGTMARCARPVAEALDEGRDIVLEIDYQGARSVRAALPEAVLVFVAPPSIEALVERLRGRNTETPETIRRRLRSARTPSFATWACSTT